MAERAVAHNHSPSASGDDGEQNPRRRARTPPPPSRRSLRREEALEGVERSATSPPTSDGEGRRDGERCLLVYGDGSTPQGALQAAGALLRHPPVVPDPETPARRWLDDVADLVMTAQQRLGAGGRSSATKASGAATAGSVSSRRRARRAAAVTRRSSAIPSSTPPTQEDVRRGPDARLSIERRRNGRRAAHATEGASSSGAPLRFGRGGQPPVPPVGGVGCRAFVASLQNVRWPPRFRPTITEKYDGSVNPAEFLQVYTTGIEAAGGDDRVMANFFPMALKGQARGWLMNLPPASVHSWEDLCQQFTMNFQGTYPRPGEEADLHAVQRRDDESLRSYIQRFCQVHNTIPCIPAHAVIYAFRGGVRHNRMLEKIASKEPQTTAELFQLADRVARKEEAWTWNSTGSGVAASAAPGSAARSGRRDRRRKKRSAHSDDEGHVLAVEGASRATRKGRPASDKKKEAGAPSRERPTGKWCTVHNTSLHDLADCRAVKSLAERTRKWEEERRQERREGKAPAAPSGNRRRFQEPRATIATVDGGACAHACRRSLKAMKRELLAAAPTHEATRRARWSEVALTFDQTDHPPCVARGGQIAMVVSPTVCNVKLGRVLIDGGAALNILSPAAFDAIKAPGMVLRPSQPIIGVTPGHTWPLGHIDLPVTFGGSANFRTERVNFDVADLSLPYNAVLGRPALVKFMAAVHYAYLQMKMPGPGGPISVYGDLKVALACMEQRADHLAAASKPEGGNERLSTFVPAAPRQRMITCDEVPEDALVSFLRANADVFAWRPADMPGVPREVIEHRLAVRPGARLVRQKVRRQAPERQAFIREEVARLLEAGFIREVLHPEWLANPVVVPKANGKLRMCIDYTDLNKACPKDPYPLPRIDQIVDSTAGCDLLCFLDAYSGYHQIRMAREDEEKTAFITPIGTYCYTTMPFGLKNAGPTFQRTTRISLGSQIGRNVEAYVDDLVVKTRNQETLLSDLAETFESLRSARIKLNPDKCVFGVPAGKLLGFLVVSAALVVERDEDNPHPAHPHPVSTRPGREQAGEAPESNGGPRPPTAGVGPPPACPTVPGTPDPQDGPGATAGRPRLSPSDPEVVGTEAECAPRGLSDEERPRDAAPSEEDRPRRKAHRVTVVTSYPLGQILHNREGTGRVVKWAIEFSEFDLHFEPRHAIKSQALADFVAEWTPAPEPISVPEASSGPSQLPHTAYWVMQFDGSLSLQGAGAGVMLTSPNGDVLRYLVRLDFRATNNMAEYEGLLAGLRVAAGLGIRRLLVLGDSQLVVNQVSKEYQCSDPQMDAYVRQVRRMERHFDGIELRHVPRRDNAVADELSRLASSRAQTPPGAFEERLAQPSARPDPLGETDAPERPPRPVGVQASGPEGSVPGSPRLIAWITEIQAYLADKTLPEDREGSERVRRISKRYVLVKGTVYWRAANGVLLKCIPREQGVELLADVHEGECGAHSTSRTLVGKAFRQGFYWPTALNDAVDLVRRCRACQFHARQTHQLAQALQTIPLSWPFAVWGLDILGPFRRAPGRFEYLYVAVDKFTKWPEAYPVIKIDKHSTLKFIRGITARFRVPNRIITDNGTQFTSELFGDYCEDMGIKLCFASPAHPRSNGQLERANAEILKGLKTKTFNILKKHGDSWIEELPAVLWANRTTPSRATGETPFFLVYGAEAVLPSELTLRSPRATMYCEADQDQLRRDDLDYLQERRRRAALRAARYQQSLRRYHQRHVRARSLCVDDLVLRRVQTRAGLSKLSPMWEGPYRVIGVPRPGSVRLATGDGTELPNPWNIEHLRRFYP
uniref:Retrotransposon protein, putative, unclassified n=1 Tax=Oryza sativa subsp. japonica TaxID=39947 RepID=Q10T61_ORYSJ|nr:retrotransposon protein, putative, unclassified [Oryza sativa Japonica Group]